MKNKTGPAMSYFWTLPAMRKAWGIVERLPAESLQQWKESWKDHIERANPPLFCALTISTILMT